MTKLRYLSEKKKESQENHIIRVLISSYILYILIEKQFQLGKNDSNTLLLEDSDNYLTVYKYKKKIENAFLILCQFLFY